MIPMCDVSGQYKLLQSEIDAAMQSVAEGNRYILGPNVEAFENEIAKATDCQHGVGVASGTDALHLALRALRIGPGDEVITTPFTFVATSEAIGMVGATPVFVDIDPKTYNIDPLLIEDAVTDHTKAILPVHLYGQACDMGAIMQLARKYGLKVIEDCAQALGARWQGRPVGSWGDAGCFSFFPSKNLGGIGDGGMVTTNNRETFERIEMLRRHGGRVKYYHDELGLNSRLDELQAAVLQIKFQWLDSWNERRRQIASRYNQLLANEDLVRCPQESHGLQVSSKDGGEHNLDTDSYESDSTAVFNQYTITVDRRDAVQAGLKDRGISSAIYYPIPLHQQRLYANSDQASRTFMNAENVAGRCLSLPMHPLLEDRDVQKVAQSLCEVVHELSDLRNCA